MTALRPLLNELQVALGNLYGDDLLKLILFGSYARAEHNAGSDVDVLIVLRGEVEPALEIGRFSQLCAALSLKYDQVISPIFMSAARFTDEQSPLLLRVRHEGVAL